MIPKKPLKNLKNINQIKFCLAEHPKQNLLHLLIAPINPPTNNKPHHLHSFLLTGPPQIIQLPINNFEKLTIFFLQLFK